jgi:SecD/SecF fusion protein
MKSIIYYLVFIIISLTLTSSVPKNSEKTKSITLLATGKSLSSTSLKRSADIISVRLKFFGLNSFEIRVLPDKDELILVLPEKTSVSEIKGLITLKGEVAFYETFDRQEITELFRSDNQLFKLITPVKEQNSSDPRIGCSLSENVSNVDEYLHSCKTMANCKLTWGFESKKSGYCLFALKTDGAGKALLERSDFDSVKIVTGKDPDERRIQIRLKPSAAGIFAEATKSNINKTIAIVIDDYVYSSPVVKSVIDKGEIEVTGSFTEKEAGYLPAIFNSEQLPSGFKILK